MQIQPLKTTLLWLGLVLVACGGGAALPVTEVPATPPPGEAGSPTTVPATAEAPVEVTAAPPAATFDPAQVDLLLEQVRQSLPPDAFDGGVSAIGLTSPPGSSMPLWAVHSNGFVNYSLQSPPTHFIAIYGFDGSGWRELARHDFNPIDSAGAYPLAPDIIPQGAVAQVDIDPSLVMLTVEGGIGAHGGTFHLLSFDGSALTVQVANNNDSPGAGFIEDINGDGRNDVVLDQTNAYVFCYACGVRQIRFSVYGWEPEQRRLADVIPQPLLMGQPQPVREPVNMAVALAEAGLWKDAMAKMEAGRRIAGEQTEPVDTWTIDWNYGLIKLHADAMASVIPQSAYPVLDQVLYGDYAAAADVLRAYTPAQVFDPAGPLITGTVAEGWVNELGSYATQSAVAALALDPAYLGLLPPEQVAAMYLIRAWGSYLVDPANPQIVGDLEQAVALAPGDTFYAGCLDYVN